MKEQNNQSLVDALCRYFQLNPEKVSYAETVEMVAIYRYAQRFAGAQTPSQALDALRLLTSQTPLPGRSRRKRLYQLFLYCQTQEDIALGLDTTTLRVPLPMPWHENYY